MGLEKAHEGYEYQDLLTAYFILNEILEETDSEFYIDKKEFAGDRIDDLKIKNRAGQKKIQIKYSSESDHTFQKGDIAGDAGYGIALDKLYENWNATPAKNLTQFRLCLAWNAPKGKLLDFIEPVAGEGSFISATTKVFRIKGEAIWPEGQNLPTGSWKRFRKEAAKINRNQFLEFCQQLKIETELPKFNLSLNNPGQLERHVIEQTKKLGIGIFPNEHIKPDHLILSLTALIKGARSNGAVLDMQGIFHELNIRTNYGTIEQNFPIVKNENLERNGTLNKIESDIENFGKVILLGEPGSGKSWLIENLQKFLKKKGIRTVKHYCYTGLDDLLQKERIKLNIFYANLIHDILTAFPELKQFKENKFASSLSELNNLLKNIKEPTYLIVDGLDHIERVFNFRETRDISIQDVAIIESLEKLEVSPFVKVIITSQNIQQLEDITSFHRIHMPSWDEEDIKSLLRKIKINNRIVRNRSALSAILFEKCEGNPLYLKYLLDEIKKSSENSGDLLDRLPPYSINLSEYYRYLLRQLNMREDVPQVLSGVNFSLTKFELEEITDSGDHIKESLEILSPVLKINFSQSGYIIYHESFRRYIIEQLKKASVSVEKKVFRPVINWFESKDFFAYRKAYRYALQLLYESGEFAKILHKLKYSFVADSVIHGQPWDFIEMNYRYFVKAASIEKDFPKLILINEIDKVIATGGDNLSDVFTLYFEVLGNIYGFSYVSDYLLFEGKPSLSVSDGLKACYICDKNGIAAPWEQYIGLYKKGDTIEDDNLTFYIRGALILQETKRVVSMVEQAEKSGYQKFLDAFYNETLLYKNKEYLEILTKKSPVVKRLIYAENVTPSYSQKQLFILADKILAIDHSPSQETKILGNFFSGVRKHREDRKFLTELINKFKAKNWFYNWIIYWLKIINLNSTSKVSFYAVKEAFDYLQYSTDPFLGKPRVSDLYTVKNLVYQSLQEGLALLKTEDEWKEIIDLLVEVGSETTVSIQRSSWGPLDTTTLFKLFGEFCDDVNRDYINKIFEILTQEKEGYRLHSDIAEYNLRLSLLFSLASNKEKAVHYFRKGIECLLAYTKHLDRTLYDAIEGVEWIAPIDPDNSLGYLKTIKILVDSAVHHTDGKETQYFPALWFERFLRIDFHKASLYLLNDLVKSRYYWIAERSLVDILCQADGQINSVIEFYIAFTFPLNDAQKFISYCLTLHDKLVVDHPGLAEKMIARIISSVEPRRNRDFPHELVERINKAIMQYDGSYEIPIKGKNRLATNRVPSQLSIVLRKEFSDMSVDELKDYIETNGVTSNDITPLCYYFDQFEWLDSSIKEVIQAIVNKNNRQYSDKVDIDVMFQTGNEIECYYWTCRFFYDLGGWFERFVNQKAFKKAIMIDREKAIEFLFELMPSGLEIGFNQVFSSNLIKTLSENSFDKEVLLEMWEQLLKITSYRLPFKDTIEWEPLLQDELDMNQEEIFICMLICRFNAATTERYRHVTVSLKHILDRSPHKMEKPFKWFFSHRGNFLKPALIIILQLLLEHKNKDHLYHLKFEAEIRAIFPDHYFLIDFIISQLYNIPLSEIIQPAGIFYPTISSEQYDSFMRGNRRFQPITETGINLELVFSKHMAGFRRKYGHLFESYWSNSHKMSVSNIFNAEYLLEIMNTDLYNHFKYWQSVEHKTVFKYATFIDTEAIVAFGNSFTFRPPDLPKPFELKDVYTKIDEIKESDWVRLAHYEKSLKEESVLRYQQVNSYGAIIFSDTAEEIMPYNTYRTFPFYIWDEIVPDFNYDEAIVFSYLQEDQLEYYKLLWLNPTIVKFLELTVNNSEAGLVAMNFNNEVVLIMRTWMMSYIGESYGSRLSEEIPKLEGTDLIVRKDYFKKITELFGKKPTYRMLKIEQE